jgi:hypothetical protein
LLLVPSEVLELYDAGEGVGLESGVDEVVGLGSGVGEGVGLESGVDEGVGLGSGVYEGVGLESGVYEGVGLGSGVDEVDEDGSDSGVGAT